MTRLRILDKPRLTYFKKAKEIQCYLQYKTIGFIFSNAQTYYEQPNCNLINEKSLKN